MWEPRVSGAQIVSIDSSKTRVVQWTYSLTLSCSSLLMLLRRKLHGLTWCIAARISTTQRVVHSAYSLTTLVFFAADYAVREAPRTYLVRWISQQCVMHSTCFAMITGIFASGAAVCDAPTSYVLCCDALSRHCSRLAYSSKLSQLISVIHNIAAAVARGKASLNIRIRAVSQNVRNASPSSSLIQESTPAQASAPGCCYSRSATPPKTPSSHIMPC